MFFFLSKILTFLISPTVLILMLLIFAVISKSPKKRRMWLLSSLILLAIFSNPFIINQAMKQWELKDNSFAARKHYDIAVVLSGFLLQDEESGRFVFGNAVNRLTESLILYRKGRIDKILISGGSGSIVNDTREATLAKIFLVSYCGVPDSVVLTDTISRNSYENAVESKKILFKEKAKTSLLITSAFHMRRAKGCFDKLDIPIDIYSSEPTHTKQKYYPSDLIIPNTDSISQWETLLHEISGVIMYKLKGYN